MKDRIGIAVLAVVAVVLVGLVAVRAWQLFSPPTRERTVQVRPGEMTAQDAFYRRPTKETVVRGYVFAGGGFPARLCTGLRTGSPADCVGPYLVLENLDPSRVPVREAKGVVWSTEPIAFLGTVTADRLTVREIVG
ncbi:MAG TPA: hypothetical protein VM938_12430 [Acidimicrobiales bacterium]|nr:hypothetical protein [Acidimicrobiales bacterium]